VTSNLALAVADIIRQRSGTLVMTPSATKHHAASAAVRRIRAPQEECAVFLDVTENQEENAKALVFIALVLIAPASKILHRGTIKWWF
jgi:hypothetical protein